MPWGLLTGFMFRLFAHLQGHSVNVHRGFTTGTIVVGSEIQLDWTGPDVVRKIKLKFLPGLRISHLIVKHLAQVIILIEDCNVLEIGDKFLGFDWLA